MLLFSFWDFSPSYLVVFFTCRRFSRFLVSLFNFLAVSNTCLFSKERMSLSILLLPISSSPNLHDPILTIHYQSLGLLLLKQIFSWISWCHFFFFFKWNYFSNYFFSTFQTFFFQLFFFKLLFQTTLIGRTDIETPILWPPDVKNWLIRKDPDAGKDWRREEKGTAEGDMVGWPHRLNGHEVE